MLRAASNVPDALGAVLGAMRALTDDAQSAHVAMLPPASDLLPCYEQIVAAALSLRDTTRSKCTDKRLALYFSAFVWAVLLDQPEVA